MKIASLVFAFLLLFTVASAEAREISIRSMEGAEYAKFLQRSCHSDQWKVIAPFLESAKFSEMEFPSYDFEIDRTSIRSKRESFALELVKGRPRMTVEGRVFEGSLCEIVAGFARESKVARTSIFDLLIPRADAREVLKTERTKADYAKWAAIGVAAGGAAILTGGTSLLLAGAFVAAGSGAILGDWLSPKLDFNRRLLEDESKRYKFVAIKCTPSTVVLKSDNGTTATLTRGRDPDLYLKTPRYEGRLRASFSARAKYLARHFDKCRGSKDLAQFNPEAQRRKSPAVPASLAPNPVLPTTLATATAMVPEPPPAGEWLDDASSGSASSDPVDAAVGGSSSLDAYEGEASR